PLLDGTALEVAMAIYRIMMVFGFAESVLHDNGSDFVNEVSKMFCKLSKRTRRSISAYHPQTNGLVERENRNFRSALRKLSPPNATKPDPDWDLKCYAIAQSQYLSQGSSWWFDSSRTYVFSPSSMALRTHGGRRRCGRGIPGRPNEELH